MTPLNTKHLTIPTEKRRYGRGPFGTLDFPGASKATSGVQKTQVILGWGAIWPSLGSLMRTNGSQDQLVVIILHKMNPLVKTNGTQDQLVVIILRKNMQTSYVYLSYPLHLSELSHLPMHTMLWVAGGICTLKV